MILFNKFIIYKIKPIGKQLKENQNLSKNVFKNKYLIL